MKLNEFICSFLNTNNVKKFFGIPGVQNIMFYDNNLVDSILVTNEQAAGFISCGLYQSNREISCLNLLGGPGLTHCIPGIANAFLSKIPIFCIITEIKTIPYKFQIHDVNNTNILKDITCDIKKLENVNDIQEIITTLFESMIKNSQPVALLIPSNFKVVLSLVNSKYLNKIIITIYFHSHFSACTDAQ